MAANIPIFINCRDRVSELRELVAWLEKAGHQRITFIDNDSTWEPLLEYYKQTPHEVVYLNANVGSRAIWKAQMVPNEFFVYTDPDVIPIEACPLDAVERLRCLLNEWDIPKAGLGLYLDDVPTSLSCLEWERSLVSPERALEPGVYNSLVDTTFALYRPRVQFDYAALRLGFPYQVRHMSWYRSELTDEDRYYLANATAAPHFSSWAEEVRKEGF